MKLDRPIPANELGACPMRHSLLRRPCRAFLVLFAVTVTSVPVCAQGQSPTSPTQAPTSRQGRTATDSSTIPRRAPGARATQSGTSQERSTGGRFSGRIGERLRQSRGERSDESTRQGTRATRGATGREATATEAEAPPKEGQGPQDVQRREPGAGAAPGPRVSSGAAGGLGAGFAARMTRGGLSNISMLSPKGAFEPAYDRELVYGDVPEVGEKIVFLEGPMGLTEFLQTINLSTNWSIIATQDVSKMNMPYFILIDTSPRQALELLKTHEIFFEFKEELNALYVMTKKEWLEREYGELEQHEFTVEHADVAYIQTMISSLLSGAGRVITDERTRHIYVWDTPDNLKHMIAVVTELDVPLEKTEFSVQHADLADIEGVLNSFLSPNGSLLSDGRTGQIFVWDSPTKLDQMRLAVNRLDVPVEARTFDIINLNAEDVTDVVEDMLSERGLIQVDPRYNALVITDLPTRLDKIADTIQTLDRELETRTWVIKYADVDFIADQAEIHIPDEMGEIVVNEEAHQITITGLPTRLDEVDKLIQTWDIKLKQVLIEAFIVGVTSDIERQFNINWSYYTSADGQPLVVHSEEGFPGVAQASGSGQAVSVGQLPYAVPLYGALEVDSSGGISRPILSDISDNQLIDHFAGNKLAVALDYLDKQDKATILSSPRVTVQDGQEAIFENATRVPYMSATSRYNDNQTTGSYYRYYGNTNRVEFIDVGTILAVLPRVTEENDILLDISAEDSTFTDKSIVANDQVSTVPQKTVRRAETQLRVKSGETVVLGGLRRDRASHAVTKTPLLGDLPLLGRLFRNPNRQSTNDTLLIFITTTIVDEYTHPETVALAKAGETIADAQRHIEKNLWGRMADRLSKGTNEMAVSVGQTGTLHSEGKRVTVEEVRKVFFDLGPRAKTRVVIRAHPRAPEAVVTDLTEAAMEAGLKIEFDDNVIPLVPSRTPHEEAAQALPNSTPAPASAAPSGSS